MCVLSCRVRVRVCVVLAATLGKKVCVSVCVLGSRSIDPSSEPGLTPVPPLAGLADLADLADPSRPGV